MKEQDNQKYMRQQSPQTFRNIQNPPPSTKQTDKSPNNQTFHTTLRYSTLGTSQVANSIHSPGIRCPQISVYTCEICSKLRLVCPLKNKNIESINYQSKHSNVQNNTNISKQTKFQTTKNVTFNKRPQTPEFHNNVFQHGNYQNLGIKFIDSLPYIPRPLTTSRKSLTKGIQLTTKIQKNNVIDQSIPIIKIVPNQQNTQTQNTRLVYSNVNTPTQTRIIEQVYFVPYIHNVIVPQIINPQVSTVRTSREQKHQKYSNQSAEKSRVPSPNQSPIIVNQYRQNGLLTPQNFKKLAQSLRR